MVAVVNGYLCFTTCDAKQAKQGKDPNAKPGETPDEAKKKHGLNGQPATVLDGVLKNLKNALDPSKRGDPGNPVSGQSLPGDASRHRPRHRASTCSPEERPRPGMTR